MENQFIIGMLIGIITFVVGNLLLIGIKGENKKVDVNTFKAYLDAIDKRLDAIENRITKIEEILLRKKRYFNDD